MENQDLMDLLAGLGFNKTAEAAAALAPPAKGKTVASEKKNIDKLGGLVDALLGEISKTAQDGEMPVEGGAEPPVEEMPAGPAAGAPVEEAPADGAAPDSLEEILAFLAEYEERVAAGEQPSEEETALYTALKQQLEQGEMPKESSYAHLVEKVACARLMGTSKGLQPAMVKAAARRHNEIVKERNQEMNKTAALNQAIDDMVFQKIAHAVVQDQQMIKAAADEDRIFLLKLAKEAPEAFVALYKASSALEAGVTDSPATSAGATSDPLSADVRGTAQESMVDQAIQTLVDKKSMDAPAAPTLDVLFSNVSEEKTAQANKIASLEATVNKLVKFAALLASQKK